MVPQLLQWPLGNRDIPTLESFVAVLNSVGLMIGVKSA